MKIYLTIRESEILKLICLGKTNKEIGAHLNISLNTTKAHISNILHKLKVKTRMEAAIYAIKNQTVDI